MNDDTTELGKLLNDMRTDFDLEDAKDLTGELDLEALRRELGMPEENGTAGENAQPVNEAAEAAEPAEPAEPEEEAPEQLNLFEKADSADAFADFFRETGEEVGAVQPAVHKEEAASADPADGNDDGNLPDDPMPKNVRQAEENAGKADSAPAAQPAKASAGTVTVASEKELELPDDEDDDEEEERPAGKEKKQKKKKDSSGVPDYVSILHDVSWLLIAVCLIFVFLIRLVGVSGPSMNPTLYNGDRVFILSNIWYHDYKDGDVVVAISDSYDSSKPLVKRVIATEGQTIDIDWDTGTVYVDGEAIEEDYLKETMGRYTIETVELPATVPEGCIFVMGDNRNNSIDSRSVKIGFIEKDNVIGKVIFRVWPLSSIGTVK